MGCQLTSPVTALMRAHKSSMALYYHFSCSQITMWCWPQSLWHANITICWDWTKHVLAKGFIRLDDKLQPIGTSLEKEVCIVCEPRGWKRDISRELVLQPVACSDNSFRQASFCGPPSENRYQIYLITKNVKELYYVLFTTMKTKHKISSYVSVPALRTSGNNLCSKIESCPS